MNWKKKIAVLLAVLIVAATGLTGCANQSNGSQGTGKQESTQSTAAGEAGESKETTEGQSQTDPQPAAATGTLVLGENQFNGVFSPFFATSAYDVDRVQWIDLRNPAHHG